MPRKPTRSALFALLATLAFALSLPRQTAAHPEDLLSLSL